MVRLRLIIIALSLNTLALSVAQGTVAITYVDTSGAEKKPHWKAKSFTIEKSENGFIYKKIQTWVALPPLLQLESGNDDFQVLENSENNKSPFYSDKNVESVLRFEHFDSKVVFPIRKRLKAGDSTIRLKIENLIAAPIIFVSSTCAEEGIEIENPKDIKGILSVDCKIVNGNLQIGIWSSENLEGSDLISQQAQIGGTQANHTMLSFKPHGIEHLSTHNIYKIRSTDGKQAYQIVYKRRQTPSSPVPSTIKRKKIAGNFKPKTKIAPALSQPSVTLFSAGFYGSKLGMESDFLIDFKPIDSTGFLSLAGQIPFKAFRNNSEDTFIEVGASYNYPLKLSVVFPMTIGLGLKGIKFDDLLTNKIILTGPEIHARIIDLNLYGSRLQYSMNISYMPLMLHANYRGSRLLWDFLNLRVFRSDFGDISLTTKYSFIEAEFNNRKYTDSKILSGVSLQW